jgi:hypothetical protein
LPIFFSQQHYIYTVLVMQSDLFTASAVFVPRVTITAPNTRMRQWLRNLLLLWKIVVGIALLSQRAFAQQTVPRFEIGPLVSWINLDSEESGFDAQELHRGLGGRFTFNFRRSLGIDAEIAGYSSSGQVIWRTAANLKVTARKEESVKTNVFGIAGIGTMKQTRFLGSGAVFREATSHGPLFNLGGGLEYVPHKHVAVRFGLTDSIFQPPRIPELSDEIRHKVDISVSLMFRAK